MLAAKSTHKRKRNATRRDQEHARLPYGKSIVTLLKGKQRALEEQPKLDAIIQSHPFNHQLCAVLPQSQKVDAQILAEHLPKPDTCKSYHARISPCLFLDPLFVTAYVKRGSLLALSVGQLDQDDVLCVDGKGCLHLSLTRDTYQTLGLQGQPYKQSQTSSGRAGDRTSGTADRFVVSIDLRAAYFTPGKPGYDRTLARFKAWDEQRNDPEHKGSWKVIMSWTNDGSSVSGDEIHFPSRYSQTESIRLLEPTYTITTLEDVWTPTVSSASLLRSGWPEAVKTQSTSDDRLEWQDWLEQASAWTEWSALAACASDSVRTFARPDDVNMYQVAEERKRASSIIVRYTGFLTAALGQRVSKALWKLSSDSFVSIHSTGFADSPVCWTSKKSDDVRVGLHADDALRALSQFEREADVQEEEESGDDSEEEEEGEERNTGVQARRMRNKRRQKRSYNNPLHQGQQVRNASSACTTSGWQMVLFDSYESESYTDCIMIENLGDAIRS